MLMKMNNVSFWLCNTCKKEINNLVDENQQLRKENEYLKQENESMKIRMDKIEVKFNNISEQTTTGDMQIEDIIVRWPELFNFFLSYITNLGRI